MLHDVTQERESALTCLWQEFQVADGAYFRARLSFCAIRGGGSEAHACDRDGPGNELVRGAQAPRTCWEEIGWKLVATSNGGVKSFISGRFSLEKVSPFAGQGDDLVEKT